LSDIHTCMHMSDTACQLCLHALVCVCVQVLRLALKQPEVLVMGAASLGVKLDALPKALGLPQKRVRDVVEACPELLRRLVCLRLWPALCSGACGLPT
jgi:hypothetical protein